MEQVIHKPRIAAMILALLIMSFGFLVFLSGYFALLEWRSEQATVIAIAMVWILAGPAMFVSGLWLLGSLGRARIALRIGGAAILTCGMVMAVLSLIHI